jgi:hypothetical protein
MIVWVGAVIGAGCTPLIYPVNYHSIRGNVGYQLSAPGPVPCTDAKVVNPAGVDSGELPPGLELGSDGSIAGVPTMPGSWHAVIRRPRFACGERVVPDEWVSLSFDIAGGAQK